MLCDDAGQSLESDTMIALTGYLPLRSITLIGNPNQLPPTVVSLDENEGSNFYARSLMPRLISCCPLTLLNINYRCHPAILDLPAKHSPVPSTISRSGLRGGLLGSGVFSPMRNDDLSEVTSKLKDGSMSRC